MKGGNPTFKVELRDRKGQSWGLLGDKSAYISSKGRVLQWYLYRRQWFLKFGTESVQKFTVPKRGANISSWGWGIKKGGT